MMTKTTMTTAWIKILSGPASSYATRRRRKRGRRRLGLLPKTSIASANKTKTSVKCSGLLPPAQKSREAKARETSRLTVKNQTSSFRDRVALSSTKTTRVGRLRVAQERFLSKAGATGTNNNKKRCRRLAKRPKEVAAYAAYRREVTFQNCKTHCQCC